MFEDRERGYEAKWAHDAETLFRIRARRDTRLGEWAAARMNLHDSLIEEYVAALVQTGLSGKGPDPVLEKIRADFQARGVACSDADLQAEARSQRAEAEEYFRPKARGDD
ncbi:MAG: DUF1476 domain-containing protein [Alphaproteobacteria bacterium]|nr:DUF1476 domain-containing protein [Alphaproteobacteria bacterium]